MATFNKRETITYRKGGKPVSVPIDIGKPCVVIRKENESAEPIAEDIVVKGKNRRETITFRKSTPCGNATIPPLRCTAEAEDIPPCIPHQRITGEDIVLGTITKDHLSYDLVCETKRDLLTIPAKKAFIGMLVTVIDEKAVYMLTKAPINMSDSWEKVTSAGGAYLTRDDLNESYIREQKLLEILK